MTILIKLIFILFCLFFVQLEALPSRIKKAQESSDLESPQIETRILGGLKTKQNDWNIPWYDQEQFILV